MKIQQKEDIGKHSSVAKTLTHALTLGDQHGWGAFALVAALTLDDREKASLSFSALKAQTPDHAEMTAEAAIDGTVATSFLDTPKGRDTIVAWREARDRRRAG